MNIYYKYILFFNCLGCYRRVHSIVQISKELPSNLNHAQVENILNAISETTEALDDALHIGHWLSCRLHDVAYELTRQLSIRCR